MELARRFRAASELSLQKQVELLEAGKGRDAQAAATAAAIGSDKAAQAEERAQRLIKNHREIGDNKARLFAAALSSACDQIFPTQAARDEGRRAVADFVRNFRRGRRVVDAGIVERIERELLNWARPRLMETLKQRSEAEIEDYVRREVQSRVWAEVELLEREYAARASRYTDGQQARTARVPAAMVVVDDEEGYDESEGGNDAAPYAATRPDLSERRPRQPTYAERYSAEVFGRPSEFG